MMLIECSYNLIGNTSYNIGDMARKFLPSYLKWLDYGDRTNVRQLHIPIIGTVKRSLLQAGALFIWTHTIL